MKKNAYLLKNLFTKKGSIILSHPQPLTMIILVVISIFIATPTPAANCMYTSDRLAESHSMQFSETFDSSPELDTLPSDKSPAWGLEIDALPYLTGGYYGSSWIGWHNFRLRGVISSVKLPQFVLPTDFSAWEMNVLALIFDYFPRSTGKYQGPWIGAGYEYWQSTIKIKSSMRTGELSQHILTLGGGYVHKFSDHFYINLWGAGHYALSGTELEVNGESYELPPFQAEVSLKLGWIF